MDDDLTPNDSEALGVYEPEEPDEVKTADQKEISKVAIAAGVADDIIGWFESMLHDYETVDAVKRTMNTHKGLTADEAFVIHYQISAEITNMLSKFKNQYTRPDKESSDG